MDYNLITIGTCNMCAQFVPLLSLENTRYAKSCVACVSKEMKELLDKSKSQASSLGGVSAN
ncbi:MAG: hypothetical protein NZ811_08780 [Gammaproteobacteria bacterium]|jgi:hypothetical protein|nr:hypothetical protein [Gammaproteobacteria bacterium]